MKRASGDKSSGAKSILFTLVILFLILPGFQSRYGLITEKKLTGAFQKHEKPDLGQFSWKSWLDGSFQEEFNNRLEQNIGFRNSLVRMHNQLSFSLFHQANAEGVIVGQNNELFEEDYIREYMGQYYVGDTVWNKKAARLKAVQDTLARLGKTFIVVFEPGKGSFNSDLLPRKYRNLTKSRSNYEEMIYQLGKNGVNVLDLNQYFISIKGKTEFPLFPQCGTHWSYYGAALAADTTLRYIESLRGIDLPDMKIVRNEIPDTTRHPDYDIGLAMNLMFRIPHPKTANPILQFQQGSAKTKPDVLIVGDSYYFNWLNNRIPSEVFNSCDFWYYNRNITRSDGSSAGETTGLDIKSEVLKRDIVMIMITERFIHMFAWGFDEQLYDLFYPSWRNPIEVFSNKIRTYDDEFHRMYKESLVKNISLPERINQEAMYMFFIDSRDNPEKYTSKYERMLIIELGIRGSPEWMEKMKEKAIINNISIDAQIRKDVLWMYEENYVKNK